MQFFSEVSSELDQIVFQNVRVAHCDVVLLHDLGLNSLTTVRDVLFLECQEFFYSFCLDRVVTEETQHCSR